MYNWRREERLKHGELRGVQPGETAEQAVERLLRENKELYEVNYILVKRWVLWRVDNRCTSAGTVCMDQ